MLIIVDIEISYYEIIIYFSIKMLIRTKVIIVYQCIIFALL